MPSSTEDGVFGSVLPTDPSVHFRHVVLPADFVGMAAANQAARDDAGIEEISTADGMARDYATFEHWDAHDDTLIAERHERVLGYARVEWRDLTDGTRAFFLIIIVDPRHGERRLTEAMLEWAERRLTDIAASLAGRVEPRPSAMRTYVFGSDRWLEDALAAHGWTLTGQGHEMVRPNLDDLPTPPMPPGLVVRPVGNDTASRRRVWDASAEAFRDERGESEVTEADWDGFLADPTMDPSLWVVAFDGDEIAGAVLGRIDPIENAYHDRERGIAAAVFVRRPWRRRGLARALLARALERMRDHGMTSAYLGVDGLNPNQAMHLYEGLGFVIQSTTYDWSRPIPGGEVPEASAT